MNLPAWNRYAVPVSVGVGPNVWTRSMVPRSGKDSTSTASTVSDCQKPLRSNCADFTPAMFVAHPPDPNVVVGSATASMFSRASLVSVVKS